MGSPVITEIISNPLLIGAAILAWYLGSSIVAWYRLRHIPGPFWASVSNLWIIRTASSGRGASIFEEMGRKYGSIVRIGPNYVLTDDPDFLRRTGAVRSTYNKTDWYIALRWQPYVDNTFTLRDHAVHDKRKARIGVAYNISGREVDLIEPSVDDQMVSMVELLRSKYSSGPGGNGAPPLLDFAEFASYLTMDVITRAAFGKAFGHLETDSDVTGFLKQVRDTWFMQALISEWPFLRSILFSRTYLNLFGPKVTDRTGAGKLMSGVVNIVNERFKNKTPETQKDMLGSWMQHGLGQEDCEAEGLLALVAGSETTASVMRITMLCLLSSPPVYQKLKEAVNQSIRDGVSQPITFEQAKAIPYLRSVVYEGLRIRAATAGPFPKVVPPEGDTIKGQFIPGGTMVAMNISSLLRSREIFGNEPELYRPERWLEADDEKRVNMEREVEMTFGSGRWMCAGKPIAFMELYKAFFEMFRYFDFQIANPTKPWKSCSYVVYVDEYMYLRVTKARE